MPLATKSTLVGFVFFFLIKGEEQHKNKKKLSLGYFKSSLGPINP